MRRSAIRSALAFCAVVAAILAVVVQAKAAIVVTEATVEGGRLVVQGTAGGANQEIKLDGVRSATSNAQKPSSSAFRTTCRPIASRS